MRELVVDRGDVRLAGSLWLPGTGPPRATVVMHPGSGPSDRDNDTYFPPIRRLLLDIGMAVASFDKRGVGGSTGRWQDADIVTQAADCLAAVAEIRRDPAVARLPLGLFGHSQGGWVVVEAASAAPDTAFVVTNSGPGVTPAVQERYSARSQLTASGLDDPAVEVAIARFDRMVGLMRNQTPYDDLLAHRAELDPFVPDDADEWQLWTAMMDHDPVPGLRRLRARVLALFGADDNVVPVSESVDAFVAAVPAEHLTVAALPGGNHRIQTGEPPRLVDGYADALTTFVRRAIQSS